MVENVNQFYSDLTRSEPWKSYHLSYSAYSNSEGRPTINVGISDKMQGAQSGVSHRHLPCGVVGCHMLRPKLSPLYVCKSPLKKKIVT